MARRTAQRAAIRQVLEDAARPLSPAEILSDAQRLVPRLGLTTVYRTVNALVRERWLAPVELPGAGTRYELAGKPHHHHLRCRVCDGVFDAPGCVRGLEQLAPRGCVVEAHALVLYGTCSACSRVKATAARHAERSTQA